MIVLHLIVAWRLEYIAHRAFIMIPCLNRISSGAFMRRKFSDFWRKIARGQWVTNFPPSHHMMTSSNGNIFRVTGHLCGNSPVPVNSPHKGQWRGALMFSLICVWINGWVNSREAGDLRRYGTHYDVIVITLPCRLLDSQGRFAVSATWLLSHSMQMMVTRGQVM